jgi:hypothetical protein
MVGTEEHGLAVDRGLEDVVDTAPFEPASYVCEVGVTIEPGQ